MLSKGVRFFLHSVSWWYSHLQKEKNDWTWEDLHLGIGAAVKI